VISQRKDRFQVAAKGSFGWADVDVVIGLHGLQRVTGLEMWAVTDDADPAKSCETTAYQLWYMKDMELNPEGGTWMRAVWTQVHPIRCLSARFPMQLRQGTMGPD
jgi:hypothetical protein